MIPHAGSILRQSLRIEMHEGSRGIFLDAFSSGRVAQNEHWRFREFDSRTEIALRGKLIHLSRTRMSGDATPGAALSCTAAAPARITTSTLPRQANHSPLAASHPPLSSLGCMSDYCYSASLLIVADRLPDWRPVVASLCAELETVPGVLGGISLLSESGCSARYLAKSAIDLHEATRRLWAAARRQVLHLPPLDLRKY
jgi:urease accessory protein UreH